MNTPKVTGMLLELSRDEVLGLLNNDSLLAAKVKEAELLLFSEQK